MEVSKYFQKCLFEKWRHLQKSDPNWNCLMFSLWDECTSFGEWNTVFNQLTNLIIITWICTHIIQQTLNIWNTNELKHDVLYITIPNAVKWCKDSTEQKHEKQLSIQKTTPKTGITSHYEHEIPTINCLKSTLKKIVTEKMKNLHLYHYCRNEKKTVLN